MRGKKVAKRKLSADPVFGSRVLTRFTNRMMHDGKKAVARGVIYSAFEEIKKKEKDPVEVFETAIKNVAPKMEVKSRRVGGASYQVPMEVRGDRKEALAIRWIIGAARTRPSTEYKTMAAKLAAELLDAAVGTGAAIKKRDDTHRMAEANRAFAHFRW